MMEIITAEIFQITLDLMYILTYNGDCIICSLAMVTS